VSSSSAISGGERASAVAWLTSADAAIDARLEQRDDAGSAQPLPGRAQHLRVELAAVQDQRAHHIPEPDEAARVLAPSGQLHADPIVHQHLRSIGPAVGEQVGGR
jgi:hypothetical protein